MRFKLKSGWQSGSCGLAAGVIGPVTVKSGDAPFDALAEAGKAAILDDRIVHGAHLAVAYHHVAAAETARNVVGLPWPKRGFMDPAKAGDRQRRVPELALFLSELRRDRRQRPLAFGDAAVILRAEQPEIQ